MVGYRRRRIPGPHQHEVGQKKSDSFFRKHTVFLIIICYFSFRLEAVSSVGMVTMPNYGDGNVYVLYHDTGVEALDNTIKVWNGTTQAWDHVRAVDENVFSYKNTLMIPKEFLRECGC